MIDSDWEVAKLSLPHPGQIKLNEYIISTLGINNFAYNQITSSCLCAFGLPVCDFSLNISRLYKNNVYIIKLYLFAEGAILLLEST